jgi:hypothetical protein
VVRERFERMDADDLARQAWLIEASFASMPGQPVQLVERTRCVDGDKLLPELNVLMGLQNAITDLECRPQMAARLEVLRTQAERLRQLAWQNDAEAGWLDLRPRSHGCTVGAVNLGRHRGLTGIVSFLLEMERLTGEPSWGLLGRKALNNLRRRFLDEGNQLPANEEQAICHLLQQWGIAPASTTSFATV